MGVKAASEPLQLFAAIRQAPVAGRDSFDRMQSSSSPAVYDPPDFALRLRTRCFAGVPTCARVSVPMRLTTSRIRTDEAMNRGWQARDFPHRCSVAAGTAGISRSRSSGEIKAVMDSDT